MTDEQAFAMLQLWFSKKQELSALKTSEVLTRKDLAGFYFPNPVFGTNRIDLGEGYDLKLVHKQNIKVDVAAVDQVTPKMIAKLKLPWEELFEYKPSLVKSVYDTLTEPQKVFVDGLLDITDATPDLDIVPRANYEGSQTHIAAAQAAAAAQANVYEFTIVEDMETAKAGEYYNDGEGDWWLCKAVNEAGEQDWEQVEDPNQKAEPVKPKPKRTRKGKAETS